ncbi:MAG TPA: hypothetical protein VLH10_25035, partial [Yinghuangia sp.]|nr:hypothetical protein [Yinghuangia sp.]
MHVGRGLARESRPLVCVATSGALLVFLYPGELFGRRPAVPRVSRLGAGKARLLVSVSHVDQLISSIRWSTACASPTDPVTNA